MNFTYYDFDEKEKTDDINMIFPDWEPGQERVVILSPHDDDALLGAGYTISAIQENGGECYIFIFCNGSCGYSVPEQKDDIVEIRKKESENAYQKLDINEQHIYRFDYSDYSAFSRISWKLSNGEKGSLKKMIKNLRKIEATRVLIPNDYREHIDHKAVYMMGKYNTPQAGDPVAVDWGQPTDIKSTLLYTVWGNYAPENALVQKRDSEIRANCGLTVPEKIEKKMINAVRKFESQQEIINDMLKMREQRKIDDKYLEVYIRYNPRPALDYNPYIEMIKNI